MSQVQKNLTDTITTVCASFGTVPIHVFLYGSRARGTARDHSDYDLLFFWKRRVLPNVNILQELTAALANALGRSVDLVAMTTTNKWVNHNDVDVMFFENISADCVQICGKGVSVAELINFSHKVCHVKNNI